jgi:hypothetical protein
MFYWVDNPATTNEIWPIREADRANAADMCHDCTDEGEVPEAEEEARSGLVAQSEILMFDELSLGLLLGVPEAISHLW